MSNITPVAVSGYVLIKLSDGHFTSAVHMFVSVCSNLILLMYPAYVCGAGAYGVVLADVVVVCTAYGEVHGSPAQVDLRPWSSVSKIETFENPVV
jgi:hypothetical protein